MADVHDKATRSYNMSRIRNKDTKPEMLVRRFLHAQGFRYKLHDKTLPGKPDIVLPKYKTIVFVQGCFWHGHANCKDYVIPKTRTEWWIDKINGNITRDKKAFDELSEAGWKLIILWACQLEAGKREESLKNLIKEIRE